MPDDTAALDTIARFYDLDVAHLEHDRAFYLEMARRCGSPILELGVGTGRLAIPLAQAGFRVTGVDLSAGMLAALRHKGPPPGLELVEAPFHRLRLRKRYRLAFCAFNGFMHLAAPDEQLAALQAVHHLLRAGGVLILDLPAPSPEYQAAVGELLLDWVRTDPATGHRVAKLVAAEGDASTQQERVTYFFDEIDAEGGVVRRIATFTLHHYGRYEMEHLLARAGFALERIYGSHDLEPFHADSARMILVARRP
ncbi:MAG: class I SAM-dependent methyltransferase [Dehalococcoidia bacterium]|nr:class I SAM-dependent methyltransferase [Dehalococcoidia bacterium]